MGKICWNGAALLAPVPPVLVTCGAPEHPNILTVGWTGICATHPPMTYISVRPTRYSYALIREQGAFAVNLPTKALVRAADYCGVRSGAHEDKLAACGLHIECTEQYPVPILKEAPVSLICQVRQVMPLGSHDMFLAEIVQVAADEALLDEKGRLDLGKAGLIAYAHGEYFALGEKLGSFGYSVRKKKRR